MANQGYMDIFLFAVLPYLAIITFFVVTIQRYRSKAFTYSSLSSQFLENRHHFWAMVPFHYGILALLAGHLIAFALPRQLLLWNSVPLRLFVIEVAALIAGIVTLVGIINIILRRLRNERVRVVTSFLDWTVYAFILVQVISGLMVAIRHPWGSSWFATSLTPYLRSIFLLNPQVGHVSPMPFWVKFHIVGAFLIILLFPFTRLVHILVIPNHYLFRKAQIVRWNYDRKKIRKVRM